ncbi:MAG: Cof-type HAD-IIB family hydrolase [Lachnospiraceae bacterium]|nr:Cof-type HAD-IIB family hydrolase [Lachnospiraceae bacterium]
MVKAIFFDIDGTLLSHQSGTVPLSARSAIFQLREKGIKLFTATGRHINEIQRLPVGDLPFDGYITLNGQICLDSNRTVLYDAPISTEDTERMTSIFEKKEIPILMIEADRVYINFINSTVRATQKAISTPLPEIGTYTGNKVYQYIVYGDEKDVHALTEQLSWCKMSQWNPHAFDIIPLKGGKIAGIQHILKHFGLQSQEAMAFGDGDNDIEMLHHVGIGVAMGNANDAVKRHADYLTADIDQDGVKKALEFYGIL